MVTLIASKMSIRELNTKIKELSAQSQEITIVDPQARHNIGVGILQNATIEIDGSVGYYAASLMDGPEVTINGNAGWALGDNMMSGKIQISFMTQYGS